MKKSLSPSSSNQTHKKLFTFKYKKFLKKKFSEKKKKSFFFEFSRMVYSYTPTYYSSLHDSITSLCKTILPFPFKKRRVPAIAAAEQRLSKQQSDNIKWQQESFHQILNLMGLCKEGILADSEVSAFRSHLLETLIASPADYEHSSILRDKLIFLQVNFPFLSFFYFVSILEGCVI